MAEPMDFTYMRIVRKTLHYLGSWPYGVFGETQRAYPLRHYKLLTFVYAMVFVNQSLYVKANIKELNFFDLGQSCITILMSVVCVQRLTMTSTQDYKDTLKMFVSKINLFYYRHKSEYAMKVHKEVHRICTIFCFIVHIQVVVCFVLFNITPLYNNYHSGLLSSERPVNATYKYEYSVYLLFPIEMEDGLKYLTLSLINAILTFDVGFSFCIFDLCMSLIVFHTWGHLKILDHNLRTFPRPAMLNQTGSYLENPPWYTEEESREIAQLLKDNMEHHKLLMYFMHKTSSAFGLTLFVYYAFHQICGCILLLECSKLDSIAICKFGLLTVLMYQQLIQLSIIFELIASRGEDLADAVYAVPWECMRTRERRTVQIFLCNVQASPLSLKALGLVPVGVRTMASILRTSISYFLMLQTLAKDD